MDSMHSFSNSVRLPLSRSSTNPCFLITDIPPLFGRVYSELGRTAQGKSVQSTAPHLSTITTGRGEEGGAVYSLHSKGQFVCR